MKERPILFQGAMVRALLAGTKTQTRRVMSEQPFDTAAVTVGMYHPAIVDRLGNAQPGRETFGAWWNDGERALRCPYGQPGDRLWVRETWAEVPRAVPATDEDLPWRPDGRILVYGADPQWEGARQFVCADGVMRWAKPERWKPSIHMPRWASRINLEITQVRVERLQDISEADAQAEGVKRGERFPGWYRGPLPGDSEGLQESGRNFKIPTAFAKLAYRALWESINGPGSWDANPWAWALEFKVVKP